MLLDQLKPNVIVRGPIFPEPVQVIVAIPMGTSVKLVGKGLTTNQVHGPILSPEQLAQLVSSPEKEPFDTFISAQYCYAGKSDWRWEEVLAFQMLWLAFPASILVIIWIVLAGVMLELVGLRPPPSSPRVVTLTWLIFFAAPSL